MEVFKEKDSGHDYLNGHASFLGIQHHEFCLKIVNLTVQTKEEKPWYRRQATKPSITILNNVSGIIRNGQFIALLGPSGAGKTTLLASLGGKCKLPTEGRVTINGVDVKAVKKGLIEIVPQFEVFLENITVLEHLTFVTEMKLGGVNKPLVRSKLELLMCELMLQRLAYSTIKSLSGGERRLLSLATSLLSSPRVIICDEPTTGLDSHNASLVVGSLKKLSQSGITVICSIHQPSSFLIREFNNLMLMADGRLLFYGSHEECMGMFDSINLPCPKNYNPAEFYIRAISTDPNTNISHVNRILQKYESDIKGSDSITSSVEQSSVVETEFNLVRRNWFKQIHLLIWRRTLTLKNEMKGILGQYLISMFASALLYALCFSNVDGTTQRGVQNMMGLLWIMTSDTCYVQSYNSVHAFSFDVALFRREVGMYDCSAYYISRFLCHVPRCVIHPLLFLLMTSAFVHFPDHALTYTEMFAVLVFTGLASMSYGLAMGGIVFTTGVSDELIPTVDLPLYLLAGNVIKLTSLPAWLLVIKYASHFFYGMDAMSNIYWRKIFYIECTNPSNGCINNGHEVLESYGYSPDPWFVDSVGVACLVLAWTLIGFISLKREEKKGYAY